MIVSAGGLKLRVDRRGEGPPLLLITGIGAHLDMWRPFQAVAGERELIAFDAPGVGRSQRPALPLRMPALARLVTELLDALALERVDVLGYSWGGGLAQELAHRHPERVRRLVLCATSPGLGGAAEAARGADARHAGALLPPEAGRVEPAVHRRRPRRRRACARPPRGPP